MLTFLSPFSVLVKKFQKQCIRGLRLSYIVLFAVYIIIIANCCLKGFSIILLLIVELEI